MSDRGYEPVPPGDDVPPPPDRRLWIIAGILAVIAVIAVALLVTSMDDDDEDDVATVDSTLVESTTTGSTTSSTTSTSTTTTTSEPEETTTSAPEESTTSTEAPEPPVTAEPALCREAGSDGTDPGAAAQTVFEAWTRNDTACARELMSDEALDELFSRSGAEARDDFQGCWEYTESDPHFDCAFTYEGGSTHYRLSFSPTDGWKVYDVYQVAD